MAFMKRIFCGRGRSKKTAIASRPKKIADPPIRSPCQPPLPPIPTHTSLPAPPVKSGDVIILEGGCFYDDQKWRGPTANVSQYLGKSATVISVSDSWLEVQANNESNQSKEQQTIQWPKSQIASLTTMLCDDILSEVFSYLGESDASRAIFAGRQGTQNLESIETGEQELEDATNKRPVFAITTIHDVARLLNQLGAVCKHWKAVCDDRLASMQGLVDADLIPAIGCNRLVLPALKWMCGYKLCIRSMRITNAKSHAPYIRTILRKQDTTHLKELHLSFGLAQESDESLAKAIVEECKDLDKLHIQYTGDGLCNHARQYGGDGLHNHARHEVSPAYQGLSIRELVLVSQDARVIILVNGPR